MSIAVRRPHRNAWVLAPALALAAACSSAPASHSPQELASVGRLDLGGSVLVLHSGGRDALLTDPRDAGLRRALGFLDERLLELPAELHGNAPPPGTIQFLRDVLTCPWTLRVDLDAPGPVPVRVELRAYPGSPEKASALAQTLKDMLMLFGMRSGSADDHPGLLELELPTGSLFHGTSEGGKAFVIAFGEPHSGPLELGSGGLPAGVRPGMVLGIDVGKILAVVQGYAKRFAPEDARAGRDPFAVLRSLGIEPGAPMSVAVASGIGADRTHVAMRYSGLAELTERMGALPEGAISPEILAQVPDDAVWLGITRTETTAILRTLEALGPEFGEGLEHLRAHLGIDLRADLFEPLGQTFGLYFSDRTGGGGLASGVAFAAVDDPVRMAQTLERLAAHVDAFGQQMGKGYVRVRRHEQGATPVLELDFPGLPVPLNPALALRDGVLFLGATPQALSVALEVAGGRANARAPWRTALASLGSLDDAQSVLYVDGARFARQGYGLTSALASMLENGVRSPIDPTREPGPVMPAFDVLLADVQPTVMVTRFDGADVVRVGSGDPSALVSVATTLGVLPVLVPGFAAMSVLWLAPASLLHSVSHDAAPPAFEFEGSAAQGQAYTDLWNLLDALESFSDENDGRYPETLEELLVPDADGFTWLDPAEIPLDPWGRPYVYEHDEEGVRVLTYGADGMPGGEGDDTDISSDELGYDQGWDDEDGEMWEEMGADEPEEPESDG